MARRPVRPVNAPPKRQRATRMVAADRKAMILDTAAQFFALRASGNVNKQLLANELGCGLSGD
jgi:hypothetical protein